MITGVSRWRCRCGASVKVVTETDKARINEGCRLEVGCPKCGDRQMIYAHRVIHVTTEPPNGYLSPQLEVRHGRVIPDCLFAVGMPCAILEEEMLDASAYGWCWND